MGQKFKEQRNAGIDLIRGCCILYIVGFWHLFDYTDAFPWYGNFFTARLTEVVLAVFVFVSGYLIGRKNVPFERSSIIKFYQSRLIRIYPLYLLAVVIFYAGNFLELTSSFKAALLVSMLIKPAPYTLWFITMIMLFYLVAPLLLYAVGRMRSVQFFTFVVTVTAFLVVYSLISDRLDCRLLTYFPSFAYGVFIASNRDRAEYFGKDRWKVILVLLAIFLSFLKTPYDELDAITRVPMVVLCSYFIFIFAEKLPSHKGMLYQAVFVLSYSSYCMYLFHRPVFKVCKKVYFPSDQLNQIFYLYGLCLPAIIFSAFILQKLFDAFKEKYFA